MASTARMGSTCKKFAALGAAAAATTALTVAVVPDSQADKDRDELLRLLADISRSALIRKPSRPNRWIRHDGL